MSRTNSTRLARCLWKSLNRSLCTRARQLTNAEVTKKRDELFEAEKLRQTQNVARVEKIEVRHRGPPDDCTLLMNKGLSTPFNCAMHIQEVLMTRSVLALVNGHVWDMHRPLTDDCDLQFLHFKDENPAAVNEAFWRTGSFLLGYVLENAFKDEYFVELCSFPPPNLSTGSFVYDVDLGLQHWQPNTAELNCLSRIAGKLQHEDVRFERLDVDASLALRMFEDNRHKSAQIPVMAAESVSGSSVTVYRMGRHVDITRGPLIASTQQLGRFNVTAVHPIETQNYGSLQRVQGIATPKQLSIHYWTYEFLAERAKKLSTAPLPSLRKLKTRAEDSNGI